MMQPMRRTSHVNIIPRPAGSSRALTGGQVSSRTVTGTLTDHGTARIIGRIRHPRETTGAHSRTHAPLVSHGSCSGSHCTPSSILFHDPGPVLLPPAGGCAGEGIGGGVSWHVTVVRLWLLGGLLVLFGESGCVFFGLLSAFSDVR